MWTETEKRIIETINRISQIEREKDKLEKEIKTIQVDEWIKMYGFVSAYWFNDYQTEYYLKLKKEWAG